MKEEKLISFCQDLVRLKSLSGEEGAVAQRIVKEMKALRFDDAKVDDWGNVTGLIRGRGEGRLLFEGHMDVVDVPTPEDWSVNPFGGIIKNGFLYGRGSSDMKTALAAMIHGVADLVGKACRADIYVTAVVYEEIFEGVGFGKVLDVLKPDAVILGEPNNLEVATGQKGRAEIVLETRGINAHSAHPELGVNAITSMLTLLQKINAIPEEESPFLGKGIQVPTDILSSPYPGSSIVPDRCRVTIDRRLLEDETKASVLKPVQACIDAIASRDKTFKAQASYAFASCSTYTGKILESERFYPGWYLSENHDLVKTAKKAYGSLGLDPVISTYHFCTDGSESAGKRGIPSIGIGPAQGDQAHVVDEKVEISKIVTAANIYHALARYF